MTHIRKEGDHIVDRDIIPTFQRYYFQCISDDFGFSDDIISKIISRTSGKFLCGQGLAKGMHYNIFGRPRSYSENKEILNLWKHEGLSSMSSFSY